MKILSRILILTVSTFPLTTFALFCPTNYNIINPGMTLDQVIALCGKPDSQTESIKKNDNIPQEWSYLIPQTVSMGGANGQNMQGTLKASVTFDAKGEAVNISVNGIGVGSTTICGGANLPLGATKEQVKSACGNPVFINKQQDPANFPAETKITEITYTSGNPAMTLKFENGKLVE